MEISAQLNSIINFQEKAAAEPDLAALGLADWLNSLLLNFKWAIFIINTGKDLNIWIWFDLKMVLKTSFGPKKGY